MRGANGPRFKQPCQADRGEEPAALKRQVRDNVRTQMASILGINSAYHESSACLVTDGRVAAFVEEERFSRKKHAKPALISNSGELPTRAIEYCLQEAGLGYGEIDYVAFSLDPAGRLAGHNRLDSGAPASPNGWGSQAGERIFYENTLGVVATLSRMFGRDISDSFVFVPHHLCHAYSTFFHSPHDRSAIVVVDGIGEFSSTWVGVGEGTNVRKLYEVAYPSSLGFLWEKMSEYLGFDEYAAAKVMGLSSYGREPSLPDSESLVTLSGYGSRPRLHSQMRAIVKTGTDGSFTVDNSIMRFRTCDFTGLETLFGVKKREPGTPLTSSHQDIAGALQLTTEEVMLHLAREASARTASENLCLAGGVALNCVANAEILTSGIYQNLYIEPTANDAGTAFGAAFAVWCNRFGGSRPEPIDSAFLGPEFTDQDVLKALEQHPALHYERASDIETVAAQLLARGKIVAWFQGRMEAGPRALGHRSILADPRDPCMRQRLNDEVKFREEFRPYCPSVLEEHVADWFEVGSNVPDPARYMLLAVKVRPEKKSLIPAVVHVDGTARVQCVRPRDCARFWRLIESFRRLTGIPMVLNTSFNIQEPIVCTPDDAVRTFARSPMQYLVMHDLLIEKR